MGTLTHSVKRNNKRSGFSLVEVALVFLAAAAIITIVAGGVVMIESARVSSVYGDVGKFTKAVELFYRKYQAIPGDMEDVSRLPGATPGNGNSVIDEGEERLFWQHLQLAEFIEGDFNNGVSNVPGVDVPVGPFDKTGYSIIANDNGEIIIRLSRFSNAADDLSVFTPEEAQVIDESADDGKPSTSASRVRGLNGSDATECFVGAGDDAVYNVNLDAAACVLHFVLNPYIANEDDDSSPPCPRLGATRVSNQKTCPVGYPGKVIETCRPNGWAITDITCEAAKCAGEREYVYKDERVEACPDNYTGAVLRECSATGLWIDVEDQGTYGCVADTSVCSVEGQGRILPCSQGYVGSVQQTCTNSAWETTLEACDPVECSLPTADLGGISTANLINGATEACSGSYICIKPDGSSCGITGEGVVKTCTMAGVGAGQWEVAFNSCVPNYANASVLPAGCTAASGETPGDTYSFGCPEGEAGQNNFRCVEINENGDTDWEPVGVNTCRPKSCGDFAVGSIRESRKFSCPDSMAGDVYEVCNICESGEPCYDVQDDNGDYANRDKAIWEINYSNCAPQCDGSADNAGYAYWPNADAGSSAVRSVSCMEGYFGVAVRNCSSVSASGNTPAHGAWSNPSKSCFLPPFSLTGLAFWVDANNDASIETSEGGTLSNNDHVSTWFDMSSNGVNMSDDNDNNRPLYKTSGINGKPALYFDGGDQLEAPNTTALEFERTDSFTTIGVLRNGLSDMTAANGYITKRASSVNYRGYSIGQRGGELNILASHSGFGNEIRHWLRQNTQTEEPFIHVLTYDGTSTLAGTNIYLNSYKMSKTIEGNVDNLDASMAHGSAPFRIAASGDAPTTSNNYNGHIGEILIYENALSDSRRRQVEEYLSNKWEISIAPRLEDIEGLTLWLDAADADGDADNETDPTSPMAEWYDKGPFRNHATQDSVGSRPAWVSSGLNSKPSVDFDGNDRMQFASNPFDSGTSVTYSTFFVMESDGMTDFGDGFFYNGTISAGRTIGFRGRSTGTFTNFWFFDDIDTSVAEYKDNIPYIFTTIYDDSTGRYIYINGDQKAFDGSLALDALSGTAHIGFDGGEYMTGYMNEVLIYNTAVADDERELIEQYLSAKWDIAIPWQPKNISGLAGWWDGANRGSFYSNSGTSYWKDKSDEGNDFSRATATAPAEGVIGALGALSFDGSDDVLKQNTGAAGLGNSAHTIFAVAKPASSQTVYGPLFYFYCGSTCNASQVTFDASNQIHLTDQTNTPRIVSAENYSDRVVLVTLAANASDTKIYLDGVKKLTLSGAAGGLPSTTTNTFDLGLASVQTVGRYYNGNIGEVILYDRELSNAERETVEAYLANKWPLGESWAPTQIPGLQLWLDAADAGSVVIQNNNVAEWKNKATELATLTHATGGSEVDWVPNAKNGNSVMRFNSTNGSEFVTNASLTPKTIVIVHKTPTIFAANMLLSFRDSGASGQPFIANSTPGEDNPTGLTSHVSYINGKPHLLRNDAVTSGAQTPRIFVDEYQILTTFSTTSSATPLLIHRTYNDVQHGAGDVAEVLSFNRHITMNERLLVENYLSEKWGIPVVRPNLNSPAYGLGDLALWLDAADANMIGDVRANDTGISAWANKSNVTNNPQLAALSNNAAYSALQNTSSRQPTLEPTGINGTMPSMRFDGSDSISVPNFSLYPTMTTFVVGDFVTSPAVDTLLIEHGAIINGGGTGTNGFILWGGQNSFYIRRNSANYYIGSQPVGWHGATPTVITAYNDASTLGYYINDSLPTEQTPVATVSSSDANQSLLTANLVIGSQDIATTYQTIGDFGEILIYDRYLPANERKIVEDFLVDKWINGVTASSAVGAIGASRDITVWLDASDTSHMTMSSGNNIEQISDIKGATPLYHAKQSVTSSNPLYVANVKNGNGVMRFDGVDDVLELENNDTSNPLMLKEVIGSALDTEDADFTIISVLSVDSITENDAFPTSNQLAYGVSSATGNVGLSLRTGENRLVGFTIADGQVYQSTKNISLNTFYVTALYQGAGSLYFDVNGENISKQPAEALRGGIDSAAFMLGGGNANKPFKGDIGEFITFGKMLQQNEREQIESYLGGKWGIPITTGADGASSFTDPTSVNGLTLWLDADDASTINSGGTLVEGTIITSWDDKSSNGLDMGSSNNPTYKPNVLNNKAVIESTGNGAYFYSDVVSSNRFASNNQGSAFQVYRAASGDSGAGRVNFWWESGNNRFLAHFPHTNGNSYWDFGNAGGGGRIQKANNTALQYDNWVATSYIRSPNNQGIVYVNGELFMVGTMTDLLNNTGTDSLKVFTNSTSGVYKDQIAEMLVYNIAVADADRENIENYLMTKWGIGSGVANDIAFLDNPSDLSGLVMWLDGDDETTMFLNNNCTGAATEGSNIGCWADKSPVGTSDAVQATSGDRPTFAANAVGDRSVMRFDKTSSTAGNGMTINTLDVNNPYSMFIVNRYYKQSNRGRSLQSASNNWLLGLWHGSSARHYAGGWNTSSSEQAATIGEWTIDVAVNNGASTQAYSNGVNVTSSSTAKTYPRSMALSGKGFGSEYGNIDIAEVLIYSRALSDSERTKVDAYLGNKWLAEQSSDGFDSAALELWLDASDSATLFGGDNCSTTPAPANGTDVGCWQDKSGNNRHATAPSNTASYKPHRATSTLNGRDTLRFDGTTNQLTLGANYIFSTGGLTLIAAVKDNTTNPSAQGGNIVNAGVVGNRGYGLSYDGVNGAFFYTAMDHGGTYINNGDVSFDSPFVISGVAKFQDKQTLYINGTALASAAIPSLIALTSTQVTSYSTRQGNGGPVTIGYQSKTGSEALRGFAGDIGEIMVYSRALADSEREHIEQYLMEKWIPSGADKVDDLTLWFDASDASTINAGDPTDGDEVTTWVNKADNANIPSVTNGAYNAPSFEVNELNGSSVLRFGGSASSNYSMSRSNVTRSHFINADEASLFSVQKIQEDGGLTTILNWFENSSGIQAVQFYWAPAQTDLFFKFGAHTAGDFSEHVTSQTLSDMQDWQILSAIKRSNNTGTIYRNGELKSNGTMDQIFTDNTATLSIGQTQQNLWLAEMLVYRSALSDSERVEIEGYLKDKWLPDTDGSAEMVKSANLALWLDGSDASTLYTDTACSTPVSSSPQTVQCWANKSATGSAYNAKTTSTAYMPLYLTNSMNGKSSLDFNHTQQDHMTLAGNYIFSNSGGYYMFAVVRPDKQDVLGFVYNFGFHGGQEVAINVQNSAGGIGIGIHSPTNYGGVNVSGDIASTPEVVVTGEIVFNSHISLYANSTLLSTSAITLPAVTTTQILENPTRGNGGPVTIGHQSKTHPSEAQRSFGGNISELLVYTNTTLSTSERVAVENYLMNKWGITQAENVNISNPQTPNSLVLWLDASDSSTINGGSTLTDFAAITEWRDKSDNANRAVRFRTSGDSGVRYRASSMNGYPSMAFDSIPLQVEGSAALDVASEASWFIVASTDADTGPQHGVLLSKGYDETNFRLSLDTASSKGMRFCSGANAVSCANASNGFNNMQTATPYLFTYRYKEGTPGNADFYKQDAGGNKFSLSGVSAANAISNATGSTKIMIGAQATDDAGVFAQGFRGDISEVLMYNYYLSNSEREGIENYLKSKWAMVDVPKTVNGLTLWLDASDASTINGGTLPATGALVTAVKDKSGNNVDMTSLYGNVSYGNSSSDTLNGKPVFAFSTGKTTGVGLQSTSLQWPRMINNNEMTVFGVFKDESNAGSLYWWQNSERFNLHLRQTLMFDYGLNNRLTSAAIPDYFNQWWVFVAGRSTEGKVSVEIDNNSRSHTYYHGGFTQTMASTGADVLEIGSYNNGQSIMSGSIAELLMYRRHLSLQEKTTIRRYLGAKWGIAVR